jgi:hypothetical protein
MIGVNWDLKFRLQQELFNKQITYLRNKNAKLLIRNQHLERKLHEQANNAGRRSSSRSKTIPTKEKVCKFFGFINYKLKKRMVREKNYEINRTLSTRQFRVQTTNQ